jgi:site-specific DNA recombinase
MSDTTTKFFIYARKSTDDLTRQVRSIDDQIAELSELADREHLDIADILVERQTAKIPGRPIFNAMLDRIEAGEASGILAWHPDRLARNSLDAGRIIYLVDVEKIRALRFPTFQVEMTASGKLMLGMIFNQSKYYVDNLSENVKRAQRQKLKSGLWPQKATIGYLNDRVTRGIVPDPKRSSLIRIAFELYASGNFTFGRLRDVMTERGLLSRANKPLSTSNYQYILKNPIYYGLIRFNGENYDGKHKPIVSKALFDRCQAVMHRRTKPRSAKLKPYLYRGIFLCGECGGFMTIETQKGHNYLRCTKKVGPCSQRYVREEEVSRQVAEYLRLVAVDPDEADGMISALEAERQDYVALRQESINAVRRKINDVNTRLGRLTTAYVAEALSLEEYRNAKNEVVIEKRELEDQLLTLEKKRSSWLEPAIRFVKAAKQAVSLTDDAEPTERLDFLRNVGSNLKISDRQIQVTPRGAWKLVVDSGRVAQTNAAAEISVAAFFGKLDQNLAKLGN